MKPLFAFAPHWCLLSLITASPHSKNAAAKRTEIGSGCAWCTPDPWTIDSACSTGEHSAVTSSMKNPPTDISFDATGFCSELLRPLVTEVSVVNATAGTTTSVSTVVNFTMFTPTKTRNSLASATPARTETRPALADITILSESKGDLFKRDFTVPDYLVDWYWYGRLHDGCSCLITSAAPSIVISTTETSTSYNLTVSTTITEVYTLYPKESQR